MKRVVEDKREEHVIDPKLVTFPLEEVKEVFAVAEKCLEPDPSKRPDMPGVVKMLEGIYPVKL